MIERRAGEMLHHHEVGARVGTDVVDGDDVRVVQGAGGLGFLDEAALAVGIGNLAGRKNLDGDGAPQLRVPGFEDDPHAALAQLRLNCVAAERLTDHGARIIA